MTWYPTAKEIASVVALQDGERYAYLIKKAADEGILWSLWGPDGWVLAADDAGLELAPIWPHQGYAILCANGSWDGSVPRAISVRDWLGAWIPGMERDNRRIAAFPTPIDRGVVVQPSRCSADLLVELAKYE